MQYFLLFCSRNIRDRLGRKKADADTGFAKGKTAYEIELKKDDNKVKMLVNADGKITQVFKYVKEKTK